MFAGATEIEGVLVDAPAPLTPITTLGVVELLEIVTLPVRFPDVCGIIETRIAALWPAATEMGIGGRFDNKKPVPVIETFEIVSVPPPEFVTVKSCPRVTPIPAVPKFMLEGETDMTGCAPPVPVPDKLIVETAGFVFAVMETAPDTTPAVLGANFTENVVTCPAAIVSGGVIPDTEYPAPVTATCVMVSSAVPVLVTVNVCVPEDPEATLPNDPVAPPTDIVVAVVGSGEFAPVTPVQPVCATLSTSAAAKTMKTNGLWELGRGRRTRIIRLSWISIGANR